MTFRLARTSTGFSLVYKRQVQIAELGQRILQQIKTFDMPLKQVDYVRELQPLCIIVA